jgi:hypothetical protein
MDAAADQLRPRGGAPCTWGLRMPWLPIRRDPRLVPHLLLPAGCQRISGRSDVLASAGSSLPTSRLATTSSLLRQCTGEDPSSPAAMGVRRSLQGIVRRQSIGRAFDAWRRASRRQLAGPAHEHPPRPSSVEVVEPRAVGAGTAGGLGSLRGELAGSGGAGTSAFKAHHVATGCQGAQTRFWRGGGRYGVLRELQRSHDARVELAWRNAMHPHQTAGDGVEAAPKSSSMELVVLKVHMPTRRYSGACWRPQSRVDEGEDTDAARHEHLERELCEMRCVFAADVPCQSCPLPSSPHEACGPT